MTLKILFKNHEYDFPSTYYRIPVIFVHQMDCIQPDVVHLFVLSLMGPEEKIGKK